MVLGKASQNFSPIIGIGTKLLILTQNNVTSIPLCRAVVAQLDRVPDYESGGRRFESSRPHQFFPILNRSFD